MACFSSPLTCPSLDLLGGNRLYVLLVWIHLRHLYHLMDLRHHRLVGKFYVTSLLKG
jgi:hypothetical protein